MLADHWTRGIPGATRAARVFAGGTGGPGARAAPGLDGGQVRSKTSRWLAVGLLLCLCSQGPSVRVAAQARPAPAASPENQAREAFERGRIHYDNGEFAKAAGAFEQAYKLSGREGLLYNLYLAYRDANEQEKAAEALRQYLAKVEVIENRAQLEARLKALDEGIAQRKAAEAAEAAQAAERQHAEQAAAPSAPLSQVPAATEPGPGRWWLTPVVVMGAGGALMLGSIGTGVAANSKADELEEGCPSGKDCDPDLKATADSGKTMAIVTDVLLFGGLATVAVGGVLLLLKKPKKDAGADRAPEARFACTRAGCAGGVALRF
jgi:tetratricopeptide (TPR) repeat protein